MSETLGSTPDEIEMDQNRVEQQEKNEIIKQQVKDLVVECVRNGSASIDLNDEEARKDALDELFLIIHRKDERGKLIKNPDWGWGLTGPDENGKRNLEVQFNRPTIKL